jgi:hypothetical protein
MFPHWRARRACASAGIIDGSVLGVVRADAAVWSEPEAVMREKLTPGR